MKFHMLTVENENIGVNRFDRKLWFCRCDCGTPCVTIASSVRLGRTKSCGCFKVAAIAIARMGTPADPVEGI